MLLCYYSVQGPPSRSALYPTLRFHHHPLAVLSSFLWVLTGVQGRRGPSFDTVSFSDLTPCNPVIFSWTGGVPPFSLVIYNFNTENIAQEFDGIEVGDFEWNPPQRAVGKILYAAVFDDDDFEDDTDNFVVQSASCSSISSSTTQTTSIFSIPITASPSPTHFPTTPSSTVPSSSHFSVPPPSTPSTTSAPPSAHGSSTSSSSQSLSRTSSTSQPSNSTTPGLSTTRATSSTDGSTLSPLPSSTTSAERSTSRPRRKSSVSAGEVAGIVLGAVAILAMLVALLVWRWAVRRHDRALAEDDKYTGTPLPPPRLSSQMNDGEGSHARGGYFRNVALPSSLSTQRETFLSGKAAIRRHAYVSTSPTTTTASGVAMGAATLLPPAHDERDAGAVLHVHDRNSLGVEPPTPPVPPRPINHLQQPGPLLGPIFAVASNRERGDEVKARVRGDEKPTEPAGVADVLPEVEAGAPAGTEARGELRAREQRETTREPLHGVDLDAKAGEGDGDGDGQGALGPRPVTLVESDGGVRLAGGPPGLDLLNNSNCVVTTLPPPYHRYDS